MVPVAVLGLDDVVTVVLFTVVLVVADVLGDVVEGSTAGSVDVSAPGFPDAGSTLPAGSPAPPPGASLPSVSPAGGVASSGSITTCAATAQPASTTPLAPKAPPAGATKRADVSDPARQPTPPSAPVASSHEASTTSVPKARHRRGPRLAGTRRKRARGNNAPAAANDKTTSDQAGHDLVLNAGPVGLGIDGAAVYHQCLKRVNPALRSCGR